MLDLVAFIVSLSSYPYTAGCDVSNMVGCQILKAAIGLDCVLWYTGLKYLTDRRILFFLSSIFVFAGRSSEVEIVARRERTILSRPYYYN